MYVIVISQRCTVDLNGSVELKNDIRFVSMWIEYVSYPNYVVQYGITCNQYVIIHSRIYTYRLIWSVHQVKYLLTCKLMALERGCRCSG